MNVADFIYYLRDGSNTYNVTADFYNECVTEFFRSTSQNFQDIFAHWLTHESDRQNFFVEFGATNGVDGSNTWMLEDEYRWRGILAEPIPEYFGECVNNRPRSTCFPFVVSNRSGETVDFVITDEMDLSTVATHQMNQDEHILKRQNVKEIIKVDTISLYDLLERGNAPKNINYISVDTEGTEYDILDKFFKDNDKYVVDCFTVEHNWDHDKQRRLISMFSTNGYHMIFPDISRWDYFFVRDETLKAKIVKGDLHARSSFKS